jgi:predicted Fe-Mo cluster-binding NifX family protein
MDIFTSLVVLAGILLAHYRIPFAEGGIIILISLILMKIGAENIWTALLILLDANLEPSLQAKIRKKVKSVHGVKDVGTVKIRQSGPFKMVECVITTRPSLSLYKAHTVADKVEEMIAREHEQIESIFIHVEPARGKTLQVVVPVADDQGPDYVVHGHFARSPHYLLLEINGPDSMKIVECYPNIHLKRKEHLGVKTSHLAIDHGADLVFTANIGEISFHMLKSHMIDVYNAEKGLTVKETVSRYHAGKLPLLSAPVHGIDESQVSRKPSG